MINVLTKMFETKRVKIAWWAWTWLLPALIITVVGVKIVNDPVKLNMLIGVEVMNWHWLMISALLIPVNIGLESEKWRLIVISIEKKSIWDCVKIILSGRSLNAISPFGIGDAFVKYLGVGHIERNQIFAGIALDRFSQFIPTILTGLVSLYFLIHNGFLVPINFIVIAFGVLSIFLAIGLMVFRIFRTKVKAYSALLFGISFNSFLRIFAFSSLRYIVFTTQFYLVFLCLGSELPLQILILGIGWVFLVKTLVPNVSVLGDLIKRELSAVLFFSFFTNDLALVVTAGFVVWMINIVLPAILGVFFVSEIKERL